jgi:hypothetical protein
MIEAEELSIFGNFMFNFFSLAALVATHAIKNDVTYT